MVDDENGTASKAAKVDSSSHKGGRVTLFSARIPHDRASVKPSQAASVAKATQPRPRSPSPSPSPPPALSTPASAPSSAKRSYDAAAARNDRTPDVKIEREAATAVLTAVVPGAKDQDKIKVQKLQVNHLVKVARAEYEARSKWTPEDTKEISAATQDYLAADAAPASASLLQREPQRPAAMKAPAVHDDYQDMDTVADGGNDVENSDRASEELNPGSEEARTDDDDEDMYADENAPPAWATNVVVATEVIVNSKPNTQERGNADEDAGDGGLGGGLGGGFGAGHTDGEAAEEDLGYENAVEEAKDELQVAAETADVLEPAREGSQPQEELAAQAEEAGEVASPDAGDGEARPGIIRSFFRAISFLLPGSNAHMVE